MQRAFWTGLVLLLMGALWSRAIEAGGGSVGCGIGSSCLDVARDPWSHPLGVPAPLWAVAWAVLVSSLAGRERWDRVRVATAILGAGVAVVYQVHAAFDLHRFCAACATLVAGTLLMAASCRVRLGPSALVLSLAVWGMVLLVPGMVPVGRTVAVAPSLLRLLEIRAHGKPLSQIAFVFTDFGCVACHREMPGIYQAARQRGYTLVALPVVRIQSPGSDEAASLYYLAEARGHADTFLLRSPEGYGLPDYVRAAKVDLGANEIHFASGLRYANGNRILFDGLGATGTPTVFVVKRGTATIGDRRVLSVGRPEPRVP